jgi:hypothetical protein
MKDNQEKEPSTDEEQSTSEYKKEKNLTGGEIFRTRPDRPPSLLYSWSLVIPGVKAANTWR